MKSYSTAFAFRRALEDRLNAASNVRVKVSTSQSLVYVMEGNKPLLVMPVGVGKAATPTPHGNFRMFNKQHFRRANTHGFAYRGDQIRRAYLRDRKAGESFKRPPSADGLSDYSAEYYLSEKYFTEHKTPSYE